MASKIILISGKKRHGKDTVAKMMQGALDAEILHFADPLKFILAETLEMDIDQLEAKKNVDDKYRVMLQRLGTEAMKPIFGDDVWAKVLRKKLDSPEYDGRYILVPDWRFLVESEEFAEAYKVRVNRPSVAVDWDQHASELELDDYEGYDYLLENPEDLTELQKRVDILLEDIKAHFTTEEELVEEVVAPDGAVENVD